MGTSEWTAVATACMVILSGIIGSLLAKKDSQQEKEIENLIKEIENLWKKHDEDVSTLRLLELKIAANHPDRDSIKDMFADFKAYLDEKFGRIEQAVNAVIKEADRRNK